VGFRKTFKRITLSAEYSKDADVNVFSNEIEQWLGQHLLEHETEMKRQRKEILSRS
jgi:hemerythrin